MANLPSGWRSGVLSDHDPACIRSLLATQHMVLVDMTLG